MRRGLALWLLLSLPLAASAATAPFAELLQQTREELRQEQRSGAQRIARFRQQRDARAALLASARAELAAAQQRQAELLAADAANQSRLQELRPLVEKRTGDLRELSGLARQTARASAEALAASMDAAR